MNLPRFIKSIRVWLWIIAIFLMLYHLSKLFAILGPPALIFSFGGEESNSFYGFITSINRYFNEASKNVSVAKNTIIAMAIYSGTIATFFIATLPFLLRSSNIARLIVLALISIEIFVRIALGIYYVTLPDIGELLIFSGIFTFLTRKLVAIEFSHNKRVYLDARRYDSTIL